MSLQPQWIGAKPYIEAAIWLGIAGGMWAYSYDFDRPTGQSILNVVSWPRGVLLLIAAVSAANLAAQLARLGPRDANDPATSDRNLGIGQIVSISATLSTPLIYAWFMPRVGFFVSTPIFIAAYMYIFRERRIRHLVVTNLVFFASLSVLFSRFLYLPLPTGNWPGFYEFGTIVAQTLKS